MAVVDAQVHIWASPAPQRPWPSWGPALEHRPGNPLGAAEVVARMDEAGVDRAVLVPPSFEGDHNDVVLAAAAAYPDRFGVMGRIRLDDPDAGRLLPGWRDQPGMLGVRLVFVHGGSAGWLTDGTADWFWPRAEQFGIPVALLAPGQERRIAAIARAHPRLRLLVDHLGIPTSHDRSAPLEPVVRALLPLAELPNVAVKASALPCFSTEAYPFPGLQRLVSEVVRSFGPQRVFWGSDLSRLPCRYQEVVSLFRDQLDLPPESRDLVLGDALLRWVGWP